MRVVLEARACSIIRNVLAGIEASHGTFLLPANVCPVVPLTFIAAGRTFEFIDIDPKSLCMNWDLVLERLTRPMPPVAGILYVATYGVARDISDRIRAVKSANPEALVIDDRCLAPPRLVDPDEDLADVILFSTGYAKYVDLGFGGFAQIADGVRYTSLTGCYRASHVAGMTGFYERQIENESSIDAVRLSDPGHPLNRFANWIPYDAPPIAVSEYLDLIAQQLDLVAAHKRRVNAVLEAHSPGSVQLGCAFNDWRFQVRVPHKRALLQRIFEAGHFASDHYYPASRLFSKQRCVNAEALHDEILNLFNDFNMTRERAMEIAGLVTDHLEMESRVPAGGIR